MKRKKLSLYIQMVLAVMLLISLIIIGVLLYRQNAPKSLLAHSHQNTESELQYCKNLGFSSTSHKLQQQLQDIDATHLIRKYHQSLVLLDVKEMLQDYMVIDFKKSEPERKFLNPNSFGFDAPKFKWQRIDNVKPLDVMRLTFRGNGIPKDAEKLASSELLEPKLKAFYSALTNPDTTIWKSPQTVHFTLQTHRDKTYEATSTPFISLQPITKAEYAKMKAAALPFLWNAYSSEDEDIEDAAILNDNKMDMVQGFVSGVTLDSDTIQSLYFQEILKQTRDPLEAKALKKTLIEQRSSTKDIINPQNADKHLNRLAHYDPEFSSLFLINNLFDQYNLFSVFKEGVNLRVNAIDTKLNVTYISYNVRFDKMDDLSEATFKLNNEGESYSCRNETFNISDEFFLIITDSRAYIMRVYLPDCYMTQADFEMIDDFISNIRILNNSQFSSWNPSTRDNID